MNSTKLVRLEKRNIQTHEGESGKDQCGRNMTRKLKRVGEGIMRNGKPKRKEKTNTYLCKVPFKKIRKQK